MRPQGKTKRDRLPQRRRNETLAFSHRSVEYRATVGFYPDGRIGEIFLAGGKLTSAADVEARDAAILASFAFQYGCPIETVSRALTRMPDGTAEGVVGVLLDLIEKEIRHAKD